MIVIDRCHPHPACHSEHASWPLFGLDGACDLPIGSLSSAGVASLDREARPSPSHFLAHPSLAAWWLEEYTRGTTTCEHNSGVFHTLVTEQLVYHDKVCSIRLDVCRRPWAHDRRKLLPPTRPTSTCQRQLRSQGPPTRPSSDRKVVPPARPTSIASTLRLGPRPLRNPTICFGERWMFLLSNAFPCSLDIDSSEALDPYRRDGSHSIQGALRGYAVGCCESSSGARAWTYPWGDDPFDGGDKAPSECVKQFLKRMTATPTTHGMGQKRPRPRSRTQRSIISTMTTRW